MKYRKEFSNALLAVTSRDIEPKDKFIVIVVTHYPDCVSGQRLAAAPRFFLVAFAFLL